MAFSDKPSLNYDLIRYDNWVHAERVIAIDILRSTHRCASCTAIRTCSQAMQANASIANATPATQDLETLP